MVKGWVSKKGEERGEKELGSVRVETMRRTCEGGGWGRRDSEGGKVCCSMSSRIREEAEEVAGDSGKGEREKRKARRVTRFDRDIRPAEPLLKTASI